MAAEVLNAATMADPPLPTLQLDGLRAIRALAEQSRHNSEELLIHGTLALVARCEEGDRERALESHCKAIKSLLKHWQRLAIEGGKLHLLDQRLVAARRNSDFMDVGLACATQATGALCCEPPREGASLLVHSGSRC
jgi:CheY-like chemotaxis protein